MHDYDIRKALKQRVLVAYLRDANATVIDELGIGQTRADIAVISTLLRGYEIKSDLDTLERLPTQIECYSRVFDRVTLVVGFRHAFDALQMIPDWWGVKLVEVGPRGGISFMAARSPRNNPNQCSVALASLLWKDEAVNLLAEHQLVPGVSRMSRQMVYKTLAQTVDRETIRINVCRCLKNRKVQLSGYLLT